MCRPICRSIIYHYKDCLSPIEMPWFLCQNSIDYKCKDLFFHCQFYSLHLRVYSYAGYHTHPSLRTGIEGADDSGVLGFPLSTWNFRHMSDLEEIGSEPRLLNPWHLEWASALLMGSEWKKRAQSSCLIRIELLQQWEHLRVAWPSQSKSVVPGLELQ